MVVRTIDEKDILVNPLQIIKVEEQKANVVYSVELSSSLTIKIDRKSYVKLLTWFLKYEKTLTR